MEVGGRLASSLLDALKPYNWRQNSRFLDLGLSRCVLCKCTGSSGALCEGCMLDLPWRNGQEVHRQRAGISLYGCFNYEFPLRKLISQGKFSGNVGVLQLLGSLMAQQCPFAELERVVVCPIPVSRRRHLERGYNQSWVLAETLARVMGLRIEPHWLARATHSRAQRGLTRSQRASNVRRAFRADPVVVGQRILIVDDVATTGATLAAARDALLLAGAAEVLAWVCAVVA